jgi:type II secretory ATPase GspE/PulE/Tfp pilus assembly ATPase PilB-like protein
MGQLNIAEKRLLRTAGSDQAAGRDIDIRLSTIPCTLASGS